MVFSRLSTEQFRQRMLPHAVAVYQNEWPGCQRNDVRKVDLFGGLLDKDHGVDAEIKFPDGWWLTIQEKFRDYKNWLEWRDFTMEIENASGTKNASPGEWFKLGAQLYFVGWANKSETGFQQWIIWNVAALKLLVHKQGGLTNIGTLRQNNRYGKATFYGIPLKLIADAVISKSEIRGGCSSYVSHWQEKY